MPPQLYLITPASPDMTVFSASLIAVLAAAEISAVLVSRGKDDEAAYAQRAQAIITIGQGAGCAVMLENDAALAKRLGADGVHVTAGPDAVADAIVGLKPRFIVGASTANTRHDAMIMGEMDVDYLLFGPLAGLPDPAAADLAEWWASTFEIPAVLSDPSASAANLDGRGAEFVALSASIWSAPSPAQAVRAIAETFKERA